MGRMIASVIVSKNFKNIDKWPNDDQSTSLHPSVISHSCMYVFVLKPKLRKKSSKQNN